MTMSVAQSAKDRAARVSLPRTRNLALFAATAVLLAVPCVWQKHIQANDLSSHLYNAWLANQAAAGALQGLYVVPQYTNVLFDLMLSALLRSGSVVLAERVAVIAAVQVFFWGCFALVSAVGRRPGWSSAPLLALLAYGAVFRMGFFNFYIASGLCCGAIALVWRNGPRSRWLAVPLLLLAATAHYLPVLWAVAVLGYVTIARRLSPARTWWLLGGGLASIGAAAIFLAARVPSLWTAGLRIESLFGADQALTFTAKYKIIAAGVLCIWLLLLIRRFEQPPNPLTDVACQLWFLMAAACVLLPDSIWLPLYTGGLSFITIRLSLLCFVLLCAALAPVARRSWDQLIASALLALFVAFSYVDERALNSLQQKIEQSCAGLPPGARVIANLEDSRLHVQALKHIVDVPCIGRCFDFANYEPSTSQFRLRASPGNTYVISSYDDLGDLEHDRYVFARTDFELYRLSFCGNSREICSSRVAPGERITAQGNALGSSPTFWGL